MLYAACGVTVMQRLLTYLGQDTNGSRHTKQDSVEVGLSDAIIL